VSRPEPNRLAAPLALGMLLLGGLLAPVRAADEPLVREVGPGEVDWEKGVVRVRAGAAADMRMPGPDAARADAQRRARSRAQAQLRAALEDLPLGPGHKLSKATLEAAVGRARQVSVEFQSNGGVLLALELPFVDLDPPAPAATAAPGEPLTIAVASMPLEAVTTLLLRKQELTTTAIYRLGDPPKGVTAVRGRRDRAGRLLLPAATDSPPVHRPVLIYVRSVTRK
jgi:hypothetical protein